jgi:hypothetical protein
MSAITLKSRDCRQIVGLKVASSIFFSLPLREGFSSRSLSTAPSPLLWLNQAQVQRANCFFSVTLFSNSRGSISRRKWSGIPIHPISSRFQSTRGDNASRQRFQWFFFREDRNEGFQWMDVLPIGTRPISNGQRQRQGFFSWNLSWAVTRTKMRSRFAG